MPYAGGRPGFATHGAAPPVRHEHETMQTTRSPSDLVPHEHELGLRRDLFAMRRRRLLTLLAGGGAALAGACSSGSSDDAGTAGADASSAIGEGDCVVYDGETAGPYPADGSNAANGSTANALAESGVVREDIRTSFGGVSTAEAAGAPLALTLRVVDAGDGCTPLAGRAVYLWHCDALGRYSVYDLPEENYLRGVGVTDASGEVRFTTVFPGCYAGRYPHVHFELFPSLAAATSQEGSVLISQLALPAAACEAVYADGATYGESAARFADTSIARDNVFGDNSEAQVAAQTAALSGSASAGWTGGVTVGLG